MAHVELSLTEAFVPLARAPDDSEGELVDIIGPPPAADPAAGTSFSRWAATVAAATEPCLVIDSDCKIVAASAACCRLFGIGEPELVAGLPLLDADLKLVDFTAAGGELTEPEIEKIPPLLAVTSGRAARGLLRVRCPGNIPAATLDALATPLFDGEVVAGSLTFFFVV